MKPTLETIQINAGMSECTYARDRGSTLKVCVCVGGGGGELKSLFLS